LGSIVTATSSPTFGHQNELVDLLPNCLTGNGREINPSLSRYCTLTDTLVLSHNTSVTLPIRCEVLTSESLPVLFLGQILSES
jgi:hypothetical protein